MLELVEPRVGDLELAGHGHVGVDHDAPQVVERRLTRVPLDRDVLEPSNDLRPGLRASVLCDDTLVAAPMLAEVRQARNRGFIRESFVVPKANSWMIATRESDLQGRVPFPPSR